MTKPMSSMGVNPAQALAGIGNAERLAAKDIERAKADEARVRSKRKQDKVELSGGAEAIEAVRSLKDASSEEAKDDRDAKPGYSPPKDEPTPKRLDVSG